MLLVLRRELTIAAKYYFHCLRESISKAKHYLNASADESKRTTPFAQKLGKILEREAEELLRRERNMTWKKWISHKYETLFSPRAAELMLLRNCANAHAASIAAEMNIDVENVLFFQNQKSERSSMKAELAGDMFQESSEENQCFTAYIEAPKATEEELFVFAKRLKAECPMANHMVHKIEFRRGGEYGQKIE